MSFFITGASRGLGKAFVEYYLQAGHDVYALGQSQQEVYYAYEAVDIADTKALEDALTTLLDGVEHLDMMVLNAGILGRIQDISSCELERLKHEMDVNMWANKVILDFVISQGITVKQVIAISSGASVNGSLGWNGYSLSKAALNMLMKLYASEMKNTHLCALAPGLVKTDMLTGILEGEHDTKKYTSVQSLRDSDAAGQVYSPEVVVQSIFDKMAQILECESGSFVDIRNI
jgi:benzil reductase ((S)-benzoin forming)